ncbi:Zinc/iron permease [Xylona heveae TC161]|uniref:Zinc/iron permease n=1 Tax=Xylona heveae (strain CBS 132557 / TC161) TaxID=1328760 RepID=A0A165G1S0_XYLHT|nr:Zinc/iron permease [Xylona heveae TC161]KZF21639.1 Zinc/iron permease [Xylona heveae TC161]
MLDGIFLLLSLSIVMAIASFLAGSLPLSFALKPSQLRLISTIGMGVLVGTSLIVIIPEGVETLYSASSPTHAHAHSLTRRFAPHNPVEWRWMGNKGHSVDVESPLWTSPSQTHPITGKRDDVSVAAPEDFKAPPGPVIPEDFNGSPGPVTPGDKESLDSSQDYGHASIAELPPDSAAPDVPSGTAPDSVPHEQHGEEEHNESMPEPHVWVGVALILGFILMYLIDQLPQHAVGHSHSQQRPYHISLDNLSQRFHRSASPSGGEEQEGFIQSNSTMAETRSLSTTIGLVIHAAADGIALGASTSISSTKLGLIIFVAIMVHKAPAAFGLTSVLLREGWSKREARTHLIIFSLAAPLGALGTWSLVQLLGRGIMGGDQGTQWWTGVLLLFSAGTFLYVAMHTMQEVQSANPTEASNGFGDGHAPESRPGRGPAMRDLFATIAGMLLPLVTQLFGHGH